MAISETDIKLLWGRAAGRCSNPACRADLTVLLQKGDGYHVGEMAHVIAKSTGGPRGKEQPGSDSYSNLILLCPTCHRRVDKAPEGEFPEALLHDWKSQHEKFVSELGRGVTFSSVAKLKDAVARLLIENHLLWKEFGPSSELAQRDPASNMYKYWILRKLDTIVPNNSRIVNMIESNSGLLSTQDFAEFLRFKTHAAAFQQHQYDRLDGYPRFPASFAEVFRE